MNPNVRLLFVRLVRVGLLVGWQVSQNFLKMREVTRRKYYLFRCTLKAPSAQPSLQPSLDREMWLERERKKVLQYKKNLSNLLFQH